MIDRQTVEIDVVEPVIRACDLADNEIAIVVTGWDRLSDPHEFDDPLDTVVVGRATELQYDLDNFFSIERLDGELSVGGADDATSYFGDYHITATDTDRIELPEGRYRGRVDAELMLRVAFDGAATLQKTQGGPLSLSFPHPTRVSVGFKSTVSAPEHVLIAEPTTEGLATAFSHLGTTIRTTSTKRVHRYYRDHPPLIELGEKTTIPEEVRRRRPETGIELVVPDRLEPLFAAASLAYYLGARIQIEDVSAPVLRASDADVHHEFDSLPTFQAQAGRLLRRMFYLDRLSLYAESARTEMYHAECLEEAGITVGEMADVPLAARLERYLDFSAETVDEVLPPWPFRMTVPPTPERAPQLPYLLDDLAMIELPGRPDEGRETESRGGGTGSEPMIGGPYDRTGTLSAVDPDPPAGERQPARNGLDASPPVWGTLAADPDADFTALPDADFTALPAAYEHRRTFLGKDWDERTVVVAFVGRATDDERRSVVERYARRDELSEITVERLDDPTCERLRSVFEEGADFLHYVGDCDGTGLACADGILAPASLPNNEVVSFQLDAPNSWSVGVELIEIGSVAGIVYDGTSPADREAVGTAPGELLLYQHSLATARLCAMAVDEIGTDSAVVGDGTFGFAAKWQPGEIHELTTTDDGFEVALHPYPIDPAGSYSYPPWLNDVRLMATTATFQLVPDELMSLLSSGSTPVVYDGDLYWDEKRLFLAYPVS